MISRNSILAVAVAVALGSAGFAFINTSAAQQQPAAAKAQEGKTRPVAAIIGDLNSTATQLRAVTGNPEAVFDANQRAELAPKMIPPLKGMVVLFEELMQASPNMRQNVEAQRWQFLAILTLLGDAESKALIDKTAAAPGADQKQAQNMQVMVRWWQAAKDSAAQMKVVEEVRALAKADPKDEGLVTVLSSLTAQASAPNVREAAESIVLNDLNSDAAKQLATDLKADRTLRELENQPLVIEAAKHGGGTFSSADWKGKVILVDVWATWCGPCIAELPRLTKFYEEYHPKGLEVVGVSCDQDGKALAAFLEKHKEMPWPQLFDVAKPGWHPLAEKWGIRGIPTMILIDKKGVVRSVTARQDFETLVPKLLAE